MPESGRYWKNRFNTLEERMKMLDEVESEIGSDLFVPMLKIVDMMYDEAYDCPDFYPVTV